MRGNYQVRFCGGRGAVMLFSPTQQHPMQQKVTVLEWVEGLYEEKMYEGDSAIVSPLLGTLDLTPAQVLQAQ